MKTTEGSLLQTTRFGSNPKKITCQCNAAELQDEVITIQLNSRCPVCYSLYQIAIPKQTLLGAQRMKQEVGLDTIERRMQLPKKVSAPAMYRSTDWLTGVLAL